MPRTADSERDGHKCATTGDILEAFDDSVVI